MSLVPAVPRSRRRLAVSLGVCALVLVLAGAVQHELDRSALQAQVLSRLAAALQARVEPGPSPSIRFPRTGAFNERLGYTRITEFVARLRERGFAVSAQSRQNGALADFIDAGYAAPYPEKASAGLRLLGSEGGTLFVLDDPVHVYAGIEDVPPLVVRALLSVENQALFSPAATTANPALDPARLASALVAGVRGTDTAEGTLATTVERHRHGGADGTSLASTWRRLVSASVRAYRDGPDTARAREGIVLDHLNSLPLASLPGWGQVWGLGDGLAAWYGADVAAANAALRDGAPLRVKARAFRQVLSLLLAQRRPGYYLGAGEGDLANRVDARLRQLAREGVIDAALRDAALDAWMPLRQWHDGARGGTAADNAQALRLRMQLAATLGVSTYDLDRLDLVATTTLDASLQDAVGARLRHLQRPDGVAYRFTLYERGEDGVNRVRVLADSLPATSRADAARGTALADLLGVVANDGVRQPTVLFETLRFAGGTPYETVLQQRDSTAGERVMSAQEAATLRRALERPGDADDARALHVALEGLPSGEREATLVFFAGARHFGTVSAFVPSPQPGPLLTAAQPRRLLAAIAPLLGPAVGPAPIVEVNATAAPGRSST